MSHTDSLLAELASARRRLLAEVEGLNEPLFSTRPPGGGWSAAHVFEHLARAEGHVLKNARRALETGEGVKRGLFDGLRRLPLRTGLVNLVRVRTVAALDPAEAPPRDEAIRKLEALRERTNALIEETRGRDVSGLRLRHPFFGSLPLLDMLAFLAFHEERHRRQIVRIARSLGRG